ncbi:hypothetical protein SDJN03_02976, partial [Cucurbita argyrosperma subsp. sororia]
MGSNKKHLIPLVIVLYLMLFLSSYGAARVFIPNGHMNAFEMKPITLGRIMRRDLAYGGNYSPGKQCYNCKNTNY